MFAQSSDLQQITELLKAEGETRYWEPALGVITAVTQAIVRLGNAGIPWLVSLLGEASLTDRQRGRIIETIHNIRPDLLDDKFTIEDRQMLYQGLLSIVEKIPTTQRDDTLRKIPTAFEFELGRIALAVGDPRKACKHFTAALRIAETLSKSPGGASEPTWGDKLAAIHTAMGRSLDALGKIDEAIASFQDAISAHESVTGGPAAGQTGKNIAECHIYIGELQVAARQYDQALRSFRDGYEKARFTGINLPREESELVMSLAREREGDLLLKLGDLDGAARAFAEVRKMRVKLRDVAATPLNVFNAGVSSEKLADVSVAQGKLAEALDAYTEARNDYQSVSAVDPDNTDWASAVGTAWGGMAGVLLKLNKLSEARSAYNQQLSIFDRLKSVAPDDAHVVRRYFTTLTDYGELESCENRLDAAKPYYEKALAVAQRLHEINPLNPTALRDLVVILMKSAINATRRRDLDAAIGYYKRALDPSEKMIRLAPKDRKLRSDRVGLLWNLAQVYSDCGKSDKSVPILRECHEMLKALLQTGRLDPPLDQIYGYLSTLF
jgi:tetratricopeptide (TPR) repeat protein